MPNLTSKKTKTINSSSLIKNQISNILQPVNGRVNLNVQKTNTISTQSAASQSYYIPLLEKITGEQSINVKVHLSFNATTNTLSVPNLTISNLPTCNVNASNSSNSSDLVNKSYVNTYAYFDLSGGDRWYCEDWINGTTKGKYNWDLSVVVSGTPQADFISIKNISAKPEYDFSNNHIGVLRIAGWNNSTGSDSVCTVSSQVMYNTSKLKSLRFISTVSNGNNLNNVFLGLSDTKPNQGSNSIGFRFGGTSATIFNITPVVQNTNTNSLSSSINVLEWVLLELIIQSKNITFSAKNLTTNTTYNTYSTTIPNDFDAYINIQFTSTSGIPPNSETYTPRFLFVDYIDWVVSS
jgi:hypothetical protein